MPVWAKAGIAAVMGLLGYTIVTATTFYATQAIDPTMATMNRNKYILTGLAVIGGLVFAAKGHLVTGAAIAAGALAAGLGTATSFLAGNLVEMMKPKAAPKAIAGVYGPRQIQGVYAPGGFANMGAVYQPGAFGY